MARTARFRFISWLRREREAGAAHRAEDRARRSEIQRQRALFQADPARYAQLATPDRLARVHTACGDPSSPSIAIRASGARVEMDPTTSRFGGEPYQPGGFELPDPPAVEAGQDPVLTFLAQVNLAEVHTQISDWPDGLDRLPSHGIVQIWQLRTTDGDEAIVHGDQHWAHAVWIPTVDPARHRPHTPVASCPHGGVAMAFESSFSHLESVFAPAGITDDDWITYRHFGPTHPPHQLLGRPNPQGFDPTAPTERCLLQLAPDPLLGDDWMPSAGVLLVTTPSECLGRNELSGLTATLTYS
ncbi:MAG: DUF1963 domain-containing protein [Actinomycetota bacterium]